MNKRHHSRLFAHVILWTSALFLVTFIIWANFAVLDEVTSGEGKVIPSSQVQVIQNLEGGIVNKIFVTEGQIVQKNQILMQIDNTRFLATYQEALKKIDALKIDIIRLTAEDSGKPLEYPEALKKAYPDLISYQFDLYNSHKQELKQLQLALISAQKELDLSKPLVAKGAVSEVEILRLERTVNEIQGSISKFKSVTLESLRKDQGELDALSEANKADKDRVNRTAVKSPVKGIIKKLYNNTLGGVIQPGSNIIEIVPLDDTLLIEAKIKPADIGFIHPGQNAMVKITAYDFSIYGGLEGKVEQISADTITDEKKQKEESFYIIRVRTEQNHLGTEKNPLPIIPGMLARVDVLTGHKSVLDYLLKPILKAKQSALRER